LRYKNSIWHYEKSKMRQLRGINVSRGWRLRREISSLVRFLLPCLG